MSRIIPRALVVAENTADIALPPADFDDRLSMRSLMLLSMEADNTWKPVGEIAGRIAAKLKAARRDSEKPPARTPKRTSGGSALTGKQGGERNTGGVAPTVAGGEVALSHPAGKNVID